MDPLDIAREVRKAVQVWARDSHDSNFDYDTLRGACGLASYTLYRTLKAFGYHPEFVHDEDDHDAHCWVELGDEAIDITATQFGEDYPEIYCVHKSLYPLASVSGKTSRGWRAIRAVREWEEDGQGPYLKKIQGLVNRLKNQDVSGETNQSLRRTG